ncbi:MAG: phosphate ABC transporter substrate-binding protein PstS [Terriglobales bacterium]
MLRSWVLSAVLLFGSTSLLGQTTIFGAGSTFVSPIMSKWAEQYHKIHPDIQISYLANGSGAGIGLTLTGMVDFGGTDAPVSDAQLAQAKVKVSHFPVILGADVPAYNLPEVQTQLRFMGQTLADIFLGKIKNWNDPAIAASNPGVRLPDRPILVVHRLDGSGTTYIWADYLSKVSPEWKSKVGKGTSLKWPVGIAANGNEGVSDIIRTTQGALGYIELSYAEKKKIAFGSVQNADGVFTSASISGIEEAASSLKEIPADFRVSISNAPGRNAYPIASFSWVLIPNHPKDPSRRKIVMDFLAWALTDGQRFAEDLYYAPLPRDLNSKINSVMIAQAK